MGYCSFNKIFCKKFSRKCYRVARTAKLGRPPAPRGGGGRPGQKKIKKQKKKKFFKKFFAPGLAGAPHANVGPPARNLARGRLK